MFKILREADINFGHSCPGKKHAVSDQTIYLWLRLFGQLEMIDFRRLMALVISPLARRSEKQNFLARGNSA